MPPKPSWMKRIPDIKASLEASSAAPFLDRPAVEKLFRLHRSQAVKLLRKLSSHQVGNALAAPRERVLAFVRAAQKDKEYRAEQVRRQRVGEVLQEAKADAAARAVRFPIAPSSLPRSLAELPPSIRLTPGHLAISFNDPKELLQQLYALSRALARDFSALERVARPAGPTAPDTR
jgi:hypothetical protein